MTTENTHRAAQGANSSDGGTTTADAERRHLNGGCGHAATPRREGEPARRRPPMPTPWPSKPSRRDADDLIRRHLDPRAGRPSPVWPAASPRTSTATTSWPPVTSASSRRHAPSIPAAGVPFDRYAQLRITGAIQDELRSLDTATRRGRAAMRRLDQATEVLSMELGRLPSTSEVARWLGEDTGGVNRARAESAHIAALRRPRPIDDSEVGMPPSTEPDPEGNVLGAELRQDLADAIGALPPRLALVVVAHVLDGREVKSIAADFGVTPSRVSQLCGEALLLLRSALDDTDDADARDAPRSPQRRPRRVEATVAGHVPRARCGPPATSASSTRQPTASRSCASRRVGRGRRIRRRAPAADAAVPGEHDVGPAASRCGTGTGSRPTDRPASRRCGRLLDPAGGAARRRLMPSPCSLAADTPIHPCGSCPRPTAASAAIGATARVRSARRTRSRGRAR